MELLDVCDRSRMEIDEALVQLKMNHAYRSVTTTKLQAMVEIGLIDCETRYQGKKPYNYYKITKKGQVMLEGRTTYSPYIEQMKTNDGGLYGIDPFVCWPTDDKISLVGEFTINQLREILNFISIKSI